MSVLACSVCVLSMQRVFKRGRKKDNMRNTLKSNIFLIVNRIYRVRSYSAQARTNSICILEISVIDPCVKLGRFDCSWFWMIYSQILSLCLRKYYVKITKNVRKIVHIWEFLIEFSWFKQRILKVSIYLDRKRWQQLYINKFKNLKY